MKIDSTKLEELHTALQDGMPSDAASFAQAIGCKPGDSDTIQAYVTALEKRWPDVYADDEPQPAKKKVAKKKVAKKAEPARERKFLLLNMDGTTTRLEVVKDGEKAVVFKEYVEPDVVEIIVKGKVESVDMEPIRKMNPDEVVEPYGMTAAMLLALGDIARQS